MVLNSAQCKDILIRPSRVYGVEDGYNNVIISKNFGDSWFVGGSFPELATGEGAIAELSDGRIIYSSRKHWFKNQEQATSDRHFAYSDDCGLTWHSLFTSNVPDGPTFRNLSKPMGPTHQSHYGLMGDMISINYKGKEYLLHSNVDSIWERKGLSIWVSQDDGRTWPIKKKIHKGPSAYSSLIFDDVTELVHIHYEGGYKKEYEGSFIASIHISNLINSHDSQPK